MNPDYLSESDIARLLGISAEQARKTVVYGAVASPDGELSLLTDTEP